MKRIAALLLALLLPVLATACAQTDGNMETDGTTMGTGQNLSAGEKTVGISLPNDMQQRWLDEGNALQMGLEALDCQVVLQYAAEDALLQAEQIGDMVDRKVDCLIVAGVDAFMLTDALQKAKDAGIPVIAYDRLLMNTDAVACYVGFDTMTAGIAMGNYIAADKKLETAAGESRSYSIEFFMGAAEDHNALLLHQGIMSVLQPYLDSGVLVCRSGRTAFEDTCTPGWNAQTAKTDCALHLAEHYQDTLPDIVCAASDTIAQGCREALEEADGVPGENWPLITGQGADIQAVKNILSGHQTMTAYKDYGALREDCLQAAKALLLDTPLHSAEGSIHNGVKSFPAYLTLPVTVDGQNYGQVLIDSMIYTQEQIDES